MPLIFVPTFAYRVAKQKQDQLRTTRGKERPLWELLPRDDDNDPPTFPPRAPRYQDGFRL